MDLFSTIGLDRQQTGGATCIAFTGAGGKTTSMFKLAREMLDRGFERVFVTTTTHLADSEVKLADHVFMLASVVELDRKEILQRKGVILVCGPRIGDQRVSSTGSKILKLIWELAVENRIAVLIEADGSKRRPLKAPATHEPVVPYFASTVIVVAGLSALGRTIHHQFVHRADMFAQLCQHGVGDVITPEMVVAVLASPQGGLKGIPRGVRKIALLNQADSLSSMGDACKIAKELLKVFDRVIVSENGPGLRGVRAVYAPTAGIVLAAGSSSRFGSLKQLAEWRGQAVLQKAVRTAMMGNFDTLRVVIGHEDNKIIPILDTMAEFLANRFSIVKNPDWSGGQSTSIRAGIGGLPDRIDSAIFMLADQPMVPPEILDVLLDMRAFHRSWVVAPTYHGQRANPVLFGCELFPKLLSLSGDEGGRVLLRDRTFPVSWVPWEDPGLTLDMDTREDYQHMMRMDAL